MVDAADAEARDASSAHSTHGVSHDADNAHGVSSSLSWVEMDVKVSFGPTGSDPIGTCLVHLSRSRSPGG